MNKHLIFIFRGNHLRTTLDLEDDVLIAIKAIANQKQKPMGSIVSDLLREALSAPNSLEVRNGIPLLPKRKNGKIVTFELVNQLR